jgi:alkylation response protein AidB-like acyl-CoA dehydrogenase
VDLSLSDDQLAVQASFAQFFAKECPTERVRACEPLGFDAELWRTLVDMGAVSMAVPSGAGGGGAGLVELALVTRPLGYHVAPVPLVEAAVAARLLAHTDTADAHRHLVAALEGTELVTVALRPAVDGVARLVPAGAVADAVVALDGDELVVVARAADGAPVPPNLGSSPLADRAVDAAGGERHVLARGARAAELTADALADWQVATASAMIGIAAAALDIAVAYVKERRQFGVPIGSFQSVQHKLADVATLIDGGRLLVSEAAWAGDDGAANAAALASMAFLFGGRTAQEASGAALHFHGGYGFMLEYDIQLYYRRAKAWSLAAGDPRREQRRLADLLFPPGYVPTTEWP